MTAGTPTLTEAAWRPRAHAHTARIERRIGTYLDGRRRGIAHPVIDFLFTYYSARPAQLLRWHPGFGTALIGADDYRELAGYRTRADGAVTASDDLLLRRRDLIAAIADLLAATASRPARLGCFGLHEWAMVYRDTRPRHWLPLRLGAAGTDAVVEAMPLRCTHYDAFRFFTPDAAPRNAIALTPAGRRDHEQPGCLHATMDLYRHCLKLGPLVPGELLAAAFELALDARTLDMRASPYDLAELGYSPVPIETPEGRAEYVRLQAEIAERGTTLRGQLSATCRDLLHSAGTREYSALSDA